MRLALMLPLILLAGCGESEAEQAVRRNMLDPDAAQFRDVSQCSHDSGVWRGDVNGKNTFGAYIGFKLFFYSNGIVTNVGDDEFMAMLGRCYGKSASNHSDGTIDERLADQPNDDNLSTTQLTQKPSNSAATAKSEVVDEESNFADPPKQCWMDYCPCDTSDRDYGGADKFLCDRVKAGLPVEDELMSNASGARDARRQLREFDWNSSQPQESQY